MVVIPEAFAKSTIAREGEAGRQWLADLPPLVDALCQRWGLTLDGPVLHGYLGVVVPVRRGAEACVLKVSWPDPSNMDEAQALAVWQGVGAAHLLAVEPAYHALLLERLEHRRSLNELPIDQALVVAGQLLRRLAIPTTAPFRTLRVMATAIADSLPTRWEQVGRPIPRAVLERAGEVARHNGPLSAHLLVNYDLHYDNILAGQREPWLAVDPKVVIGDPEFGIAQLLMNRLEAIESSGGLDRHFTLLCEAAALDPALARAWTLVRCVDYWLWGLSVGLTEDPKRCARMVAWLG